MANVYYGTMATDGVPGITHEGANRVVEVREAYRNTATLNNTIVKTDLFALVKLPANCVPVEMIAFGDQLDVSTKIEFQMGIFNAAATAFASTIMTDATYAATNQNFYKKASPKTVLEVAA